MIKWICAIIGWISLILGITISFVLVTPIVLYLLCYFALSLIPVLLVLVPVFFIIFGIWLIER